MNLSAGFDFSWNEASFSAIDQGGTPLFDLQIQLSGRDASSLPSWMKGALKERGADFRSVGSWTVGSGPGSFTGMRIAASLVLGLCFGQETRKRSMPSACAMAFELAKTKPFEKAVALYDGRKGDVLAFPMARGADGFIRASGPGEVLESPKGARTLEGAELLALEKDKAALARFFGEKTAAGINFLQHVKASALALNRPGDFSSRLSDLVYIRPPAFVEPMSPRAL